jgi:hypothetical protein
MWMSRNGGKDRKNKGTLRYNFSDESDDADFNQIFQKYFDDDDALP